MYKTRIRLKDMNRSVVELIVMYILLYLLKNFLTIPFLTLLEMGEETR